MSPISVIIGFYVSIGSNCIHKNVFFYLVSEYLLDQWMVDFP